MSVLRNLFWRHTTTKNVTENKRKAKKRYDLCSYINTIFVLVLISTIPLYLAQYLKEQLEFPRQHFFMQDRLSFLVSNKDEKLCSHIYEKLGKIGAKFQ